MSNVWDEVPDWGGVGALRLERRGTLGASIWEIHPGGDHWAHFHHASEELLVVLRGRPTVRTDDGERQLREGDVLTFPTGPAGVHGIRNETDEIARVLIVSTNADPDVAEYPDSGKVGIWVHERGRFFREGDAVEHAGPES
jgi:uncharacterized cupin superfamily protein